LNSRFENALGNPVEFKRELVSLAVEFQKLVGKPHIGLADIRDFVRSRNYEVTKNASEFRQMLGAFACVLIDHYAQEVRVSGLLKKKLVVISKGFRCEFLDLFYRCAFEGLDLAPEGDSLARKI